MQSVTVVLHNVFLCLDLEHEEILGSTKKSNHN